MKRTIKIFKFTFVLLLIFGWVFNYPPINLGGQGWPRIWQNPRIPPEIQEAQAATLTYVGGAEASGNSANYDVSLTGLTGGSGSAALAGDLVIVATGFVSTADGNPGVSTSEYTEVADLYRSDTRCANFSVNWKIMGSTPDTSVSCNGSLLGTNGAVCVVHVWRNANATTPLDVTTTTAVAGNASNPNSPSIIPVTAGALIISTGLGTMAAVDNSVTAPTTPNTFTNQVDISVDPGNAATVGIASYLGWSSGAYDPGAWTNFTTSTSDSWAAATLAIRPSVTTLGPGTDPDSAEVAPGSGIRDAGSFTFSTTGYSDSVTALTVVLSSGSGYDNLSEVRITSDNGAATYFSAISNPSSDTLNFSGGTPIPVTGSTVQFKIRVTPETHTNMPVPPGGNYTFSPYISTFTAAGNTAGSDSNANTLTIDNTSPNGADPTGGSAGDAKVNLNWTTSNSSDFSRSVVLRWTSGSVGSEKPAEGTDYTIAQNIDTAAVACVRTTDGASTPVTDAVDGSGGGGGCRTTALTNGLQYSYKIFQKDSNGNYDEGIVFTGSPFIPAAAGTLTVDIVDAGGIPVGSPTMEMGAEEFSFTYQTATGVFGVTDQKIRVNNTTATREWTLSIAASNGSDALWSNVGETKKYDFNDPTANAEDGSDSPDTVGGQMTINASGATLGGTCSATGITKGSSASFSEDVTDSIPLLTADVSADIGCYWDLTSVSVSQTIPASQSIDTYTLNLLLTVTPG